MGIDVPAEFLPGILFFLIAFGQLMRPFGFRNLIFSLILFEMAYLNILHMYIIYNHHSLTYYSLFPTTLPVFMSLGVLIYFYILAVKDEIQRIDRKHLRHFIPTILSILFLTVFYIVSWNESFALRDNIIIQFSLNFLFIVSWISLAAYVTVSIKKVREGLKKGNPVHRVFRQLMFLMILAFPAMITGIITSVMEWDSPLNIVYIVINSFIILSLYILIQRNPYLVQYGTVPVRRENMGKSYLANVDIINLKNNMRIIIEEERLYCDEDLSLSRLSEVLEVTPHQLSQLLNEHYNKNFYCFINNYRINDAKKMLIDEPKRSTLSIAHAVGFNSYSVFYTAFKKETLLSPAEFRKKNLKI